ncbi:MAG: class I adenylate-forming enzyme family protein [Phycisphaerae bacterium]
MHPLLNQFEQVVATQPDRPAACDQSLMLDYKSLRAVAAGLAERIAAETGRPRVGIMAPTSSACAAAIFACWYAGKTPVPLNFLLGPDQLGRVIRDAGLDCVLTVEHFAASLAPTGLKTLLLSAQTLGPGQVEPPPAEAGDTAAIIYTSGTSGDPKGVCLSFDNLVQNAQACIEHARMDPQQVFLSVVPQFHSFGFTTMTVTPLLLGATAWYLPRFSPVSVVSTIAEKGVTIFMAVASMYGVLAKMKNADRAALASLKLAISGGERLSLRIAQAFKERFGIEIMEGYGLTESSPVVAVNMPWAHRPGSVGRALPGIEVGSVDENGQTLPPGEVGELIVRGHCVMRGYHNQPDATAAVIKNGVLFTGDIGRLDPDGFVYVTGRAKEMMIIGGENVFPIEIENVLCDHPAVAEAAVVGVPDEVRGEVPLAFLILHEGAALDDKEIRTFCRQRLAGYKVPREIRIEQDLPRGPAGKILKRALKITPSR